MIWPDEIQYTGPGAEFRGFMKITPAGVHAEGVFMHTDRGMKTLTKRVFLERNATARGPLGRESSRARPDRETWSV